MREGFYLSSLILKQIDLSGLFHQKIGPVFHRRSCHGSRGPPQVTSAKVTCVGNEGRILPEQFNPETDRFIRPVSSKNRASIPSSILPWLARAPAGHLSKSYMRRE